MLDWLISTISDAYDPLYVDDRCEYQKQRDKEASFIVFCIMVTIISIPNILDWLGLIKL